MSRRLSEMTVSSGRSTIGISAPSWPRNTAGGWQGGPQAAEAGRVIKSDGNMELAAREGIDDVREHR